MRPIKLTAVSLLCLAFPASTPSEPPRDAAGLGVSFSFKFKITADQGSSGFTMNVLIPRTIPGRQKVQNIKYSLEPAEVFEKEGDLYAQFGMWKEAARDFEVLFQGEPPGDIWHWYQRVPYADKMYKLGESFIDFGNFCPCGQVHLLVLCGTSVFEER